MRMRALYAPVLSLVALAWPASAGAEGWNLDGRAAPDITMAAGMNGVSAGTRLSSFKGKVVLLKFWLRDCPICRRAMPAVQESHARWGGSGLVNLTVIHQWGPDDPVLRQYMQESGFTFPVGTDANGSLAALYGVRSRPVDYLIGVDGRVKASNSIPGDVLSRELGLYRLQRLGKVPESWKPIRDAVWQYRLGQALKDATAAAAAADASADVKAAATRMEALADEDLKSRGEWAAWLRSQRRGPELRQALDELVREYAGTSLEARAQEVKARYSAG